MSDIVTLNTPEGAIDVRPLWVSEPREIRPGDTFDISFPWPDYADPATLRFVLVVDGAA